MKLIVKNLAEITQKDPRLGDALKGVQDFSANNVAGPAGNRVASLPAALGIKTSKVPG